MATLQPDNYIEDLFLRLKLIVREALADAGINKVDVTAEWPYQQNTFPYVMLRLLPTQDSDYSEDIANENQAVGIRVVVNHLTDQAVGSRALLAYRMLVALRRYFKHHDRLRVAEAFWPDEDDDWLGDEPRWLGPTYAQIGPHTGMSVFPFGGVSNQQIGIDIALTIPVFNKVY